LKVYCAVMIMTKTDLLRNFLWFFFIALSMVYTYILLDEYGALDLLTNPNRLKIALLDLGYCGPAAIIVLMAVAIVINPIPSAPIALVAGAIYGHLWGTLYIIMGATLGALVAFSISRWLGYETLNRYLGDRVRLGWLGSQNALTGMVLVSRLIPFLSFDLVSYGAGLTPITTVRFVVATLVGLIPVSFLLAHYGGYLGMDSLTSATAIFLLLGGITIVPLLIRGFRALRKNNSSSSKALLHLPEHKE